MKSFIPLARDRYRIINSVAYSCVVFLSQKGSTANGILTYDPGEVDGHWYVVPIRL